MSTPKTASRPCIALFIDWTESMYHMELISGVRDRAQELNLNLVIYAGGNIHSPRIWESPRNVIYDYVDPGRISGIIISSGSLSHFCSHTQLAEFCDKYTHMKRVCISTPVEGIPSVVTDNTSGLKKLLEHLIVDHGFKRIAFMKGPNDNLDAKTRFQVYKDMLAAHSIEYDPGIVMQGDFIWEFGAKAIREYIKEKGVRFDVLCAANDDMAGGVSDAVNEFGLSIPNSFALTGFDDQELSRYLTPSLTTIRQPIYKQAYTSVSLLHDLLLDKPVPEIFIIETELIIRESCGCPASSLKEDNIDRETNGRVKAQTPGRNGIIINSVLSHIDEYMELARKAIENDNELPFLHRLVNHLEQSGTNTTNDLMFQHLITAIRLKILAECSSPDKARKADDMFHRVRVVVADTMRRRERFNSTVFEKGTRDFRELSEEMVSVREMEDIISILVKRVESTGLWSLFFSLFDTSTTHENEELKQSKSWLISAMNNGKILQVTPPGIPFNTIELMPHDFFPTDRAFALYVEPLFIGITYFGIALFEFDLTISPIHNVLQRMFINSVLKTAIYLRHVQLHTANLESQVQMRTDALSRANELLKSLYLDHKKAVEEVRRLNEDLEKRVEERTSQLLETNKKLKRLLRRLKHTQATLVQSEKMAALGGLVAGITHEINTPIGIGVTAATHFETKIKELEKMFQNGTLKKSDLEEHIVSGKEAARMILSNLHRAYALIKSFKNVAVDQSNEVKRMFNLKEYIDEVLLSMRPQLKKKNHKITVDCPETIEVDTYPGPLSQVISNLIMNSYIHAYDDGKTGSILMEVRKRGHNIVLEYADDGSGIKKENLQKIYEPFFTTKRGKGGSGLGLHLVYNIVTNTLGGTINCESEEGKGTRFLITFPG